MIGRYHEAGIGVGIVVGQVAGILIVWKGDSEGEGVIVLPRCSVHGSCIQTIVVSKEKK